jgi:hypothetical protein
VVTDGDRTEDLAAGPDDDVITDVRVSFVPLPERVVVVLVRLEVQGAECNILVDTDPVADGRRLPDDDTGAVVDKKVRPDTRTRVDVDPGETLRGLGQLAGVHRAARLVESVCDALDQDRLEPRVRPDHLGVTLRGGVAFVGRLDVGPEAFAERRQSVEHRRHDIGETLRRVRLYTLTEQRPERLDAFAHGLLVTDQFTGVPAPREQQPP